MKAARGGAEIVFAGPPRGASATVRLESAERVVPVTVQLPGGATTVRAHVRASGDVASRIRLNLPQGTPPGTYRGEAAFGDVRRGVVVVVEPVMRLRVQPVESRLAVRPGTKAEFAIQLANEGNVGFDVPRTASFDLDDEGQDRALGRALRAELAGGERRVDRFFEELRESHGGEARVVVSAGAGRLEPGQSSELTCVLEVPPAVRSGHRYSGAWRLGETAHVLRVEVATATRTRQGGAAQ